MIGKEHTVRAAHGDSSGMPSAFPVNIKGPDGRYSWEGQSKEWHDLIPSPGSAREFRALLRGSDKGWYWEPVRMLPADDPMRRRRR